LISTRELDAKLCHGTRFWCSMSAARDNRGSESVQHGRPHAHGVTDPLILTTRRGIWAVKWSLIILLVTGLFQLVIVLLSGSVALLADTVHNFGDAITAVPLWIAFSLARLGPSKRFTYGYGRVEDLAGVFIVFTILFSAVVAGHQSIGRLLHPEKVEFLAAVAAASIVGFLGNEMVARFRIRTGREIESAALVADGYHARVDGLTSLAVLAGAVAVWIGYPMADPVIGIIITVVILRIVWQSGKAVFTRLLDGVDPKVMDEIRHAVSHCAEVLDLSEVRVRWLGHRLHAELNVAVAAHLSVERGHELAEEVRRHILEHLPYLSNATIHLDPASASGERFHRVGSSSGNGQPVDSHTRFNEGGPMSTDARAELLAKMTAAIERIEACPEFASLIPEVRTNLVFTSENPQGPEDVVAVDGRITVVNGMPKAAGRAKFGASSHMARLVIALNGTHREIRSGINFASNPRLVRWLEGYCRKRGWTLGLIDRKGEPEDVREQEGASMGWKAAEAIRTATGKAPKLFYETGALGKEPVSVLVGGDPVQVATEACQLAREYSRAS
jgi:cation diffusion facilitator family transporter